MTPTSDPARAEAIAGPHYECEDCWYSCPLSADGCCNENEAKDVCTCGRDERVKQIMVLEDAAYQRGLSQGKEALQAADEAFNLLAVIEAGKECQLRDTQMPESPLEDYIPAGAAKAWKIVKAALRRLAEGG